MSQETLADKLGVSRQAVTKWETDRGIPDIENMMTISNLFGISVDEFLSEEKDAVSKKGYLYESVTEYDIDGRKDFNIPLDFVQTWVYVKNNRDMLATIIFHMFVNVMQEKIAMTPETKCIETVFITIAAVVIVVCNRHLFFEREHVGRLLEYQEETSPAHSAG